MTAFFGERWPSAQFMEAPEVERPLGDTCMFCPDLIDEDDSGVVTPAIELEGMRGQRAAHIECYLRCMTGDIFHLRGECSCFGGTMRDERPYREQARAVVEWLQKGERP